MSLMSKIADIDGEIQELVHESKLPALNKLLDESSGLYLERIAELEKERDELKALALLITPEVIDLIRCGIGGNYGGDRYIEKMEETHAPTLARFKALKEQVK
jgi:hypothetical protein